MQFVQDEALSPTAAGQAGLWAVAIRFDTVRPAYVQGLHDRRITVIGSDRNSFAVADWSRLRAAKVDYVLTDKPGAYLRWKG